MRKKQGGKIPKNQGQNVSLNNHFIHMEYSVVENNLYGYTILYAEYITNYHMYVYTYLLLPAVSFYRITTSFSSKGRAWQAVPQAQLQRAVMDMMN